MGIGNHNLSGIEHFIAMEYFWLILNRTYLLLLGSNHLRGIKINGLISAGRDPFAIHGDLDNPYIYAGKRYISKMNNLDLFSEETLNISTVNFELSYRDIDIVEYTHNKKWGMAHYPHDGRVFIVCGTKTREFIVIGNQSCSEIYSAISKRVDQANAS